MSLVKDDTCDFIFFIIFLRLRFALCSVPIVFVTEKKAYTYQKFMMMGRWR